MFELVKLLLCLSNSNNECVNLAYLEKQHKLKLDGVGPVDNRPCTDKPHHFVERRKKLHVTPDM